MARFTNAYSLIVTAALAFFVGKEMSAGKEPTGSLDASPRGALVSVPQGRKPPGSGHRITPTNPPKGTRTSAEPTVLPCGEGGGTASAANGILAVTGSYGVGTSVLYVIDTVKRQLAVYEARGGSRNGRRVYLVGARRIDLDLQLEGYNDLSEFSYDKLRTKFDEAGLVEEAPSTPDTGTPTESRKD